MQARCSAEEKQKVINRYFVDKDSVKYHCLRDRYSLRNNLFVDRTAQAEIF